MRKIRLLKEGALYHVTARANRKEMIFESDEIKNLFLEVIRRARRKYTFSIENFCVMGNHYHLMIRPGAGANLSRIMQWIMSVFAMAYNRIHGLVGHVWGDRFFSMIVSGLKEYLRIFTYIDENPCKARIVDNPRAWRYGGLWHHRSGLNAICDPLMDFASGMYPEHALIMIEG